MLNFDVFRITASIFTPEFSIGNTSKLINLFQDLSENRFDGELVSLPIPADTSSQIPRIVIKSKEGTWQLEISLERTNISYIKSLVEAQATPNILDFGKEVSKIFGAYKSKTDISIQRLALITERYSKIEKDTPSQYIANRFCKTEFLKQPFNRTTAFEIHSLKKYIYKDFKINSWVRVKSAMLADDQKTPIINVLSDINTYAINEDPEIRFAQEDIARFFNNIPEHLDSIIKLYFS